MPRKALWVVTWRRVRRLYLSKFYLAGRGMSAIPEEAVVSQGISVRNVSSFEGTAVIAAMSCA